MLFQFSFAAAYYEASDLTPHVPEVKYTITSNLEYFQYDVQDTNT